MLTPSKIKQFQTRNAKAKESRISENAQQSLVEDNNGNEVVERDESIAIEVDVLSQDL